MNIFSWERDDGVADLVIASASLVAETTLRPLEISRGYDKGLVEKAFAGYGMAGISSDYDLYYLRDIMATAGVTNANGDHLPIEEVWQAVVSAVNKPFNFNHDFSDICGHIISSEATNDDLEVIKADTDVASLPDKFHVVTSSVLYRNYGDDDRKKLMASTIEEIQAGEWSVSMECLLHGFDYRVVDPEGIATIVARTEESAWLTKYLRAYKGTGVFADKKSGITYGVERYLRNIVFCGKGFTKKPANPESIILGSKTPQIQENDSMNEEQFKAAIKAAEDRAAAAEAKVAEAAAAQTAAKAAEATAAKTEADGLRLQLNEAKATVTEIATKLATSEATIAELTTVVNEFKVEAAKATRLAVLKEKGCEDAEASTLVAKFASLPDEAFASIVDTIAVKWATPAPASVAVATAVLDTAKPTTPVVNATATAVADKPETARASAASYLSGFTRAGKNAAK